MFAARLMFLNLGVGLDWSKVDLIEKMAVNSKKFEFLTKRGNVFYT
jgi:hypothetical protein